MVGLIQSLQIVAKCPKDMPLLPICKIPQRIKIKNSVVEIRIRLNINAPHQAAMTALVNTRQNVSSLDLVQQFAVVAVPVVAHWQDGMVFAVYW